VHGDRAGSVRDPFGHRWAIATHIEDVSAEEIERRIAEFA
jgi:PhnB protein